MTHVFIVGSKGIPASYGGFETFADKLVHGLQSKDIKYHVSCMGEEREFEYAGAHCFGVKVPVPGAPGRILHMGLVMDRVIEWKKENPDEKAVVYILGCRIGPLLRLSAEKLRGMGVRIYCNPDGLEWKRAKWNRSAKKFLKYCEGELVKNSDLAICDSRAIEDYIKSTYDTKTMYISYGADFRGPYKGVTEQAYQEWCTANGTEANGYYLIVGRFVPENNYETIIREFIKSDTKRKLVIISNVENNKFYKRLIETIQNDTRICFAGTVYDQDLLSMIRENAFAYLHGHEVGGTNPSLLEAMATTRLNILLDVPFNKEVGRDGVLYFSKTNLASIIHLAESMTDEEIEVLSKKAKNVIKEDYNWEKICREYEEVFLHD